MNYDTFAEARERILQLREIGLDGFEAYYTNMPPEYTEGLLKLAEEYGFVISGGSDYHGANKPGVEMGTGRDGNLSVPDEVLVQLKKVHHLRQMRMTS